MRHQTMRRRIVAELYHFWERHAWGWAPTTLVSEALDLPPESLAPDFWYLYQRGFVALDEEYLKTHPEEPKHVRLTAAGIDYYRELQMGKFKF